MATISQIQRGYTRFIDTNLSGAFDGWQKAVVIGSATLLGLNMPNLIRTYSRHPLITALGVYHAESESVNIDALYDAFVPMLGHDKFPIAIPKVGTIKIGKDEIDILMRYIKEA